MFKEATISRYFAYLTTYCALLFAGALILQHGFGLHPCPLCIMARFVVFALIGLYLVATLHRPKKTGALIYLSVGSFLTFLGILITSRHLWLLHLPPELVPDCSPGFDYLVKNFPWNEAFIIMFKSSGECAGEHHAFLGISLPGWTFLAFAILAIANIALIVYQKKKGSNATPP